MVYFNHLKSTKKVLKILIKISTQKPLKVDTKVPYLEVL